MPTQLKYVDPNRPRSLFSRAFASFASTRLGLFISRNVLWKIDPYLLRATRGRVSTGLVIPTAVLETRGAKTDAARRNAVIYVHDGDRVTIVASKATQDTRRGITIFGPTPTSRSEVSPCGRRW